MATSGFTCSLEFRKQPYGYALEESTFFHEIRIPFHVQYSTALSRGGIVVYAGGDLVAIALPSRGNFIVTDDLFLWTRVRLKMCLIPNLNAWLRYRV